MRDNIQGRHEKLLEIAGILQSAQVPQAPPHKLQGKANCTDYGCYADRLHFFHWFIKWSQLSLL